MTTMEINCVLCICYNGLFMCDIQPLGLCSHRSIDRFLTRSTRIKRALNLIQYRFKDIHSFESITRHNMTFDDDTRMTNLNGYRIVLNHSSLKIPSVLLLCVCLLIIYFFQ